jgi:hypothetical protein
MGVEFVMPIFLRKERGKLEQVRIKQLSTGFEYNLAKREVVNDIYAAYNDVKTLNVSFLFSSKLPAIRNFY